MAFAVKLEYPRISVAKPFFARQFQLFDSSHGLRVESSHVGEERVDFLQINVLKIVVPGSVDPGNALGLHPQFREGKN